MIKHYCDMCARWIVDGDFYPMRITCRKIARPGVCFDLMYCKDCMKLIIPTGMREAEERKRVELSERVAKRKAAKLATTEKSKNGGKATDE